MVEGQKKSLQVLHGGNFGTPALFDTLKYDSKAEVASPKSTYSSVKAFKPMKHK